MTSHFWIESSGTTQICANCGCGEVRGYSSALPRSPSIYTKWRPRLNRWAQGWGRSDTTREYPSCLPDERGHTVPTWVKTEAEELRERRATARQSLRGGQG